MSSDKFIVPDQIQFDVIAHLIFYRQGHRKQRSRGSIQTKDHLEVGETSQRLDYNTLHTLQSIEDQDCLKLRQVD